MSSMRALPGRMVPALIAASLLSLLALAPAVGVARAQTVVQVRQAESAAPGSPGVPSAEELANAGVLQRFLAAAAGGDMADALALIAAGASFADARPSACTELSPCITLAAIAADLAMHRADQSVATEVTDVWVSGSSVYARLEERSWYREAVGVDRTITDVTAEVHDGQLTGYRASADLGDEQTRNLKAFHTGWTPELMARVR